MKKQKSLLKLENAKAIVEMAKASGVPYQLKISNYTTEITSEIFGSPIQFMKNMRSNSCFAAFQKIKSDITGKPLPIVSKHSLKYFDHSIFETRDIFDVCHIDLKSAYATVLLNEGYISQKTYDYLQGIPKIDRLACVGMLASKKYIFDYGKNGIENFEIATSGTESLFYYCVKRTWDLMNELKEISDNRYIFSWVDCIYFQNAPGLKEKLFNHLASKKYHFHIDYADKVSASVTNYAAKIEVYSGNKTKQFKTPAIENGFAKDFIALLTDNTIQL